MGKIHADSEKIIIRCYNSINNANVAELAYALVLGTSPARGEGSTPSVCKLMIFMITVYALASKKYNFIYDGLINNLPRRLMLHNNGG